MSGGERVEAVGQKENSEYPAATFFEQVQYSKDVTVGASSCVRRGTLQSQQTSSQKH